LRKLTSPSVMGNQSSPHRSIIKMTQEWVLYLWWGRFERMSFLVRRGVQRGLAARRFGSRLLSGGPTEEEAQLIAKLRRGPHKLQAESVGPFLVYDGVVRYKKNIALHIWSEALGGICFFWIFYNFYNDFDVFSGKRLPWIGKEENPSL